MVHFRPVITRWSGSTSRMRVIGEARNANLLSRTRLIAVSVVYWWVGNLYDMCIGLTELDGLSQSPCKSEVLRVPQFYQLKTIYNDKICLFTTYDFM